MAALSPGSAIEEGIEHFLQHLEKERNYARNTLVSYQNDLQQFARFLYPRMADIRLPLRLMRRELVAGFIQELQDRGLRASSVARKLAAVRSYFRFLCREGVLVGNPASGLGSPRPGRRIPPFLELRQIEQAIELPLVSEFRGSRDRAILEVFYGGGIRLAELVGLNLTALKLEEGTVRVMGRGRKERIVPIGRLALAALKGYLQQRAELLVGLDITQVEAGALFLNARGRRLTRRTVQRVVERYLGRVVAQPDEEGQTGRQGGLYPHLLRHTFATHLLDAGADLPAIKELLGNASLAATQIYAEISPERLCEIYTSAHPRAKLREEEDRVSPDTPPTAVHLPCVP